MNKIVKIETEKTKPEIDWSKSQYLVNSYGDILVVSTGEHQEDTFTSICISGGVPAQRYTTTPGWFKSAFRPLAPGEIVTVQFSND